MLLIGVGLVQPGGFNLVAMGNQKVPEMESQMLIFLFMKKHSLVGSLGLLSPLYVALLDANVIAL